MINDVPDAQSFAGPASVHFFVAALVLEIIFYAAFVVTFAIGTWLLLCRTPPQMRRQTSTVMLLVANTVMFLLSTTVRHYHSCSSCIWLRTELQHFALDIYAATLGYFGASPAIEDAKFMLYVSQTLIGDGFMVRHDVCSSSLPSLICPSSDLQALSGLQ